ncbi:hypothetical protein [Nitrospira sp. M1]
MKALLSKSFLGFLTLFHFSEIVGSTPWAGSPELGKSLPARALR